MFSWLANAWRVPELRHRVLFTGMILALYRLGSWIPAPGVDSASIQSYFNNKGGTLLGFLSVFSGGALSRFSLFALGIMPYVTASIILQLLTVVIPKLEQLQKEGEAGYAKINQYTRYLTVMLAAAPAGVSAWYNGGPMEKLFFPLIAIAIVVAVVVVQEGQRRIPIQYAKRMVGRRLTSGQSTYMPLRVNMAGVIPIIFAAALLALPQTFGSFSPSAQTFINRHFSYSSLNYLLVEATLIIVFTYFYTAVQFNPVDQADNLRKYGGYIPGIRPGPPTAQYLDRVLSRLTLPGSCYLGLIAVMPGLFIYYFNFSQATSRALGGTSVIIVVGVALDTMRQMESQMMMRSYEGFLK